MSTVQAIHELYVASRRARCLSAHFARLIPQNSSVLDVGCGDGEIAWLIGQERPDLRIRGVDVLVRNQTRVPVDPYDGQTLPLADHSVDVVTLIDVLHHCEQPVAVLREAARVARQAIVIKDHNLCGFGAKTTLRFMDWVGNHRYGVALPYHYLRPDQWTSAFGDLDLKVQSYCRNLGLYPFPANHVFERGLHFIARLLCNGGHEIAIHE